MPCEGGAHMLVKVLYVGSDSPNRERNDIWLCDELHRQYAGRAYPRQHQGPREIARTSDAQELDSEDACAERQHLPPGFHVTQDEAYAGRCRR